LKWANKAIAKDYSDNKPLYETLMSDLKEYEQNIELHYPTEILSPSEEEIKKRGWWQFWR
jgi:hypothetical protein